MFYTFEQNNPGGVFMISHRVAPYVIIEAQDAESANDRAENIAGIYFNGCDEDIDCNCCGDRWYKVCEDDAYETPTVYGTPVGELTGFKWAQPGEPYAHVYYMDGSKETFYV